MGGPNRTPEFAAEYYNHAMKHGYQVVINDRSWSYFVLRGLVSLTFLLSCMVIGCGDVPDYDSPEYAKFPTVQPRRWETSEGLDPYSYGFNSATDPSAYKNGTTIIQSLVDIVSKNGN